MEDIIAPLSVMLPPRSPERVLSPVIALVFFALTEFLLYLDRGAVAVIPTQSLVPRFQSSDTFGLSDTEAGALGSIFMLGYICASPAFGYYVQTVHPFYLISLGLCVWIVAVVGTALSEDYWMLLISRALTGTAEAAFCTLASPYLLEVAPMHQKTVLSTQLWMSVYYIAIFSGLACGLIYGDSVASELSWRWVFGIEAIAMCPFAVFPVLAKRYARLEEPEELANSEALPFMSQMKMLAANGPYMMAALGNSAFVFMAGAVTFWGPTFQTEMFGVSTLEAGVVLGSMVLASGVIGSLSGSVFIDCMSHSALSAYEQGQGDLDWLMFKRLEIATLSLLVTNCIAGVVAIFGTIMKEYWAFTLLWGVALFVSSL